MKPVSVFVAIRLAAFVLLLVACHMPAASSHGLAGLRKAIKEGISGEVPGQMHLPPRKRESAHRINNLQQLAHHVVGYLVSKRFRTPGNIPLTFLVSLVDAENDSPMFGSTREDCGSLPDPSDECASKPNGFLGPVTEPIMLPGYLQQNCNVEKVIYAVFWWPESETVEPDIDDDSEIREALIGSFEHCSNDPSTGNAWHSPREKNRVYQCMNKWLAENQHPNLNSYTGALLIDGIDMGGAFSSPDGRHFSFSVHVMVQQASDPGAELFEYTAVEETWYLIVIP